MRPPCATARCLANFLQLFLCQRRAKRGQNKAMAGRELRGMFESRHSGSDGPKSGHGVVFIDSPPAVARKVQGAQEMPDRPDPPPRGNYPKMVAAATKIIIGGAL